MTQLKFSIEIDAPVNIVYETMLGLKDKATYEHWSSVFNPTSTFEGDWQKGSKIYFVGLDGEGKKGGMISRVLENIPSEIVTIEHYGFLNGDIEILSGKDVEQWSGGKEIYQFKEENGKTHLTILLDTIEEHLEFFQEKYPVALGKLKNICEGNN